MWQPVCNCSIRTSQSLIVNYPCRSCESFRWKWGCFGFFILLPSWPFSIQTLCASFFRCAALLTVKCIRSLSSLWREVRWRAWSQFTFIALLCDCIRGEFPSCVYAHKREFKQGRLRVTNVLDPLLYPPPPPVSSSNYAVFRGALRHGLTLSASLDPRRPLFARSDCLLQQTTTLFT